jgi:hypothetical protein
LVHFLVAPECSEWAGNVPAEAIARHSLTKQISSFITPVYFR